MNEALKTKLSQALRGQSPQHNGTRTRKASATTRDLHPSRGSEAILQLAASSNGARNISSLNVLHADGTQGKAFCWGVAGFGWGQGEWE